MPGWPPSDNARRQALAAALGRALGRADLRLGPITAATGGCIDAAFVVDAGGTLVFVKLAGNRTRLVAEADGLRALAACPAIRVPQVLGIEDLDDGTTLLALEYLPLQTDGDERALGRAVAALHEIHGPAFGWDRDNFIGATPQINTRNKDWPTFFAECRLAPQMRLATAVDRRLAALAEPLLAALPVLLADHRPPPSLVHGDLWRGNVGFVADQPALFDPAVHYGDGETDLAMSALFGGFGAGYYAAYHELRPAPPGHELRRDLYMLYHVLNHVNLFGGGYVDQARQLGERLLARVR